MRLEESVQFPNSFVSCKFSWLVPSQRRWWITNQKPSLDIGQTPQTTCCQCWSWQYKISTENFLFAAFSGPTQVAVVSCGTWRECERRPVIARTLGEGNIALFRNFVRARTQQNVQSTLLTQMQGHYTCPETNPNLGPLHFQPSLSASTSGEIRIARLSRSIRAKKPTFERIVK